MALLRQAVRSVAQAGCFQTAEWWVLFFLKMQSTFRQSNIFLAGPCPACSSTRQCVVSIATVFLASKSLYTILIRSAIFAYWQYESTEIWCKVIKVACSVYMVRAHAVIITGWTTYIFINLNWWDIIVTCFFPGTTHNTSLICSRSNQSLKHHQYFFSFLYTTQTRDLNRGTACKSMLMLRKTCWEWFKPAKTNATLVGKHLVDLLETIFFRAPVLLMAVMSSKFYPGLFLARKEWHVRVVVHKW